MLILRSFYRKKSTKIYIIIISFLLIISSILILSRNYFNSYINDIYMDSYMVVDSVDNIKNDLEKNKYVKKVYNGITIDKETLDPVLIEDDSVTDNKLFYPYYMYNTDIEKIEIENNEYTIIPIKGDNPYYRISNHMYNKIKSDNNINYYIYVVELKNWFDNEKLEKVLYKNYNIENIITNTRTKKNINFNIELIILLFNIVSIFLIILFIIILIITITNIREDESNNKYLLRCLGYNQKEIIYYSSIKITWLFITSVIINLIIISTILFLVDLLLVKINIDYYITNIVINIDLFIVIFILSFSRYIYYYIKDKIKKLHLNYILKI